MTDEAELNEPAFFYFPYLQIEAAIEIGSSSLVPSSAIDPSWWQTPYGERAHQVLSAHRGPNDSQLEDPTVVNPQSQAGLSSREANLLAGAVAFALISQNARGMAIDWQRSWEGYATLENATLWGVHIDLEHGFISSSRGGLVRSMVGGLRLGEPTLRFPAPRDLIAVAHATLDHELLHAVHDVARRGLDERNQLEASVATAIHWHSKAWDNSESIGMTDRLVYLKSALEALGMSNGSAQALSTLSAIYSSIDKTYGADKFLWKKVANRYKRVDSKGRTHQLQPFEHWFWLLSDTRNRIIHDGHAPGINYRRGRSPFNGNLFEVGERVVRELITIRLAHLGYPRLVLDESERRISDMFAANGTPLKHVGQI